MEGETTHSITKNRTDDRGREIRLEGGYVTHIKHVTHVKLYKDEEELYLSKSSGLTLEVHQLIENEKNRLLEEEGRKVSRSKIVCNLIIEKYGSGNNHANKKRF